MPYEPRGYQIRAIDAARREFASGIKRMLLVSPTGSGKTFMSSHITRSHLERNPEHRVLFVAYGRELIRQASQTYESYGIPNGIIMAGDDYIPEYSVQVASVDTLMSRAVRTSRIRLPKFSMVIWDEAHRILANKFQRVLDLYQNAWHIGLTATPIRGDGRSLGNVFQSLVNVVSYEELLRDGYIVPVRVFAPSEPDLRGVKTTAGDYNQKQLQQAMDKVQLVGDVFTHWQKHASYRQTVIFASGVEHSIHLRDEFRSHGITAEHIDGSTPTDERDETLRRFAVGDVQVVSNYGCLVEGWDSPECSCLILCRPTKKLGPYRQMVGRILRPSPGKSDAIILDHAGAVHRHGWPTDDIEWSIDPDENIQARYEAKRKARDTSNPDKASITCIQCHAVRKGGPVCPNCGFKHERNGVGADMADGTLTEVKRERLTKEQREHNDRILKKLQHEQKQQSWDRYVGICLHNNWPIKRACGMYKQEFGVWPRGLNNMPRGQEEYQMPARDWYQVMVDRVRQTAGVA